MKRKYNNSPSGNQKQDIINFLNEYSFKKDELSLIWQFIFYLYTGDLDLMADELQSLIKQHKGDELDNNAYINKMLQGDNFVSSDDEDYIIYQENEYMREEIDLDNSRFLNIRKDVKMYDDSNTSVNEIIKKYQNKINTNSYYLLGNYLFFTLNDVKYYTSISDYEDEENYINDIVNELNTIGCKRVMYKYGRLD